MKVSTVGLSRVVVMVPLKPVLATAAVSGLAEAETVSPAVSATAAVDSSMLATAVSLAAAVVAPAPPPPALPEPLLLELSLLAAAVAKEKVPLVPHLPPVSQEVTL